MSLSWKEEIIRNYIEAYNNFDIPSMLDLMHPDIMFKNISNGEINAQTVGKAELEAMARQSAGLFKTRRQTVKSVQILGDAMIVNIDFEAVLAADIPNGPKAGERIAFSGKSKFTFKEKLIVSIVDES